MDSTTSTSDADSGFSIGQINGQVSSQFWVSEDKACLRDLRTTNPHHDKERIEATNGGLLEDAYKWILDNPEFKQWRYQQQSQLLWIRGDPGKGKTMLLCGIINELIKSAQGNPAICFFFCQATDARINRATAVLRGLIFMLVEQQPSLISHVRRLYDKKGKQTFEDVYAWEALSEILSNILEDPRLRTTYLIIDALDECTTGVDQLLELIAQKSSAYPNVKWAVSSRDWPIIAEILGAASQKPKLCLELNEMNIAEGVTAFIHFKVQQLTQKKKYNNELRDTVSQHLLSNAQGTFLWVAFACKELSQTPARNVQKKLKEFPSGLKALYQRMLDQTRDSDDGELCKSLLSVITAVDRPITLDELASCINLVPGETPDDTDLAEILELCGSFLTLRGRTVSLIHQTAKEFLLHEQVLRLEHPDTLASVNNLANTYMNQGRWKEAENLQVQVLETRQQVMGLNHSDTLASMSNLANTYINQGRWKEAEGLQVQVLESHQKMLKLENPDILVSMNNLADTYMKQGRWKEAEELREQVLKSRQQVAGSEYPNTLSLLAGADSHNTQPPPNLEDHGDFEDSDLSVDLSTEIHSVFSLASIPSTKSLESGTGEINSFLIQEFAALLHENGTLISLISVGVSKQRIGFERMRNNFRRLLQHFANNLKAEVLSEIHRDLRCFVNSYSAMITRELFAMTPIHEERSIKSLASVKKRPVDERKVEDYLENLHRDYPPPKPADLDEESDQDSVAEEVSEDEPYEGSLQRLDQIKHFVLDSTAYQILLHQLEEFVQPSLYSNLRSLLARWSIPENKNHLDAARYKLRNLVTELQHVNPHEIQFDCDQNVSRFARLIGHYQHAVERWTGERWDWWPLPRCPRPLGASETRLLWKCACGDERLAEVPNAFAKRLRSIIRSLPTETTATQNIQPPEGIHVRSDSTPHRASNDTISIQVPHQDDGSQQAGGSSSNPSLHHRPSGLKPNTFDMSVNQQRVLLLAKQGEDYKLAQICVGNSNCDIFFGTLKEEYFRLRGVLRGWFSIWRFSHCDFYKFEKFDDHMFTPISKDAFPDDTDTNYEYKPKPMDNIPPISEHEFTKRFYACHKPRPLLHLHHKCKRLGAHSSDILKSFPKKRSELEEAGDKREDFWGIYARETISVHWIILYNLFCVSPLLAFFVAWCIPQGHSTDLQNPSIPISMMVSMLSLFWSVFLGSLPYRNLH